MFCVQSKKGCFRDVLANITWFNHFGASSLFCDLVGGSVFFLSCLTIPMKRRSQFRKRFSQSNDTICVTLFWYVWNENVRLYLRKLLPFWIDRRRWNWMWNKNVNHCKNPKNFLLRFKTIKNCDCFFFKHKNLVSSNLIWNAMKINKSVPWICSLSELFRAIKCWVNWMAYTL